MIKTLIIDGAAVRVPDAWDAFKFEGQMFLRRKLKAGGHYWVTGDGREWNEVQQRNYLHLVPRVVDGVGGA